MGLFTHSTRASLERAHYFKRDPAPPPLIVPFLLLFEHKMCKSSFSLEIK